MSTDVNVNESLVGVTLDELGKAEAHERQAFLDCPYTDHG